METTAFVLDTGFTGDLQITPEIAVYLGLKSKGVSKVQIANGQIVDMSIANVKATIEDVTKPVRATISNGMPLVGIEFLSRFGYTVIMDCKNKEIFLKK